MPVSDVQAKDLPLTGGGDASGHHDGPTEAINGRLEHLRGSALGFRNLTDDIARSLVETGGCGARLHLDREEPPYPVAPPTLIAKELRDISGPDHLSRVFSTSRSGASGRVR